MRAIAVILVLSSMTGMARADTNYSLDPAQGREGKVVSLRVDETERQCFSAGPPEILREGAVIKVRFEIEDFIPPGNPPGVCPPYRVTPRFHSLGTFAPGNYVVEVTTCSNSPPPPCRVEATLDLSVFGSSGTRFAVPTLSSAAALLLAFAVVTIGAVISKAASAAPDTRA